MSSKDVGFSLCALYFNAKITEFIIQYIFGENQILAKNICPPCCFTVIAYLKIYEDITYLEGTVFHVKYFCERNLLDTFLHASNVNTMLKQC